MMCRLPARYLKKYDMNLIGATYIRASKLPSHASFTRPAMEALGSPSISRAGMSGGHAIRKLIYVDDRYNNNILSFANLCRSFF